MKTTFRRLMLTALACVALIAPTLAQTTVNTTTLSAAVTRLQNQVTVASATNVAVGNVLYIDREALKVTVLTGTVATVRRGQEGTGSAAHASGAVVYTALPQYFFTNEVAGACTTTDEVALPHIVPVTGNIYNCHSGLWRVYARGGIPGTTGGSVGTTYSASGAIAVEPGTITLTVAGVGAMTLISPTRAQDGMVMTIVSQTAQAHTVTYTAGFNGGTTARDVATFAAAIGNSFTIVANAGTWFIVSASGVTFG